MRAAALLLALSCASAACMSDLSDVEHGTASSGVLGGSDAEDGAWPDVAAVMFGGLQACTGVLIAPTVALTAGHCNEPDLDSILVGTAALDRPEDGETIAVADRIEHPQWATTTDMTVLVLAKPSRFAPRPIATGWAAADIRNGAAVALVGYGAIDPDASLYVNELQEAETTITDAGCTEMPGCNAAVAPGGELGAGGMGIDTCPGDSGGPLYLLTGYGTFVAGITSRGYADSLYACRDGGIYARPDRVADWIEGVAGVRVARGPEPAAPRLTAVRGRGAEGSIAVNDPKTKRHTFAITQPPARGTAQVRSDGRVRYCASPDAALGDDGLTVTIADAADPARAVAVRVPVTVQDGAPAAEDCETGAFEDGGGGCCDAGRGAGGSLPLALGVLVALRRRRAPPSRGSALPWGHGRVLAQVHGVQDRDRVRREVLPVQRLDL